MWHLETATPRHIREVLADPAPQTLDDLDGEPVEDAAPRFYGRIARAGGEALIVDGRAVFVLGHVPTSPTRVAFWFIAAKGYYALGAAGVTFGRRYLARLRERNPDTTFISISNSQHPDTARWFGLLGFRPRGVSQRFELSPKEQPQCAATS